MLGRALLKRIGENIVAYWLILQDFSILARNYKIVGGEIDIIAKRGTIVVAVEVKFRKTKGTEFPVSREQIFHIRRALDMFLAKSNLNYRQRLFLAVVVRFTKLQGFRLNVYKI